MKEYEPLKNHTTFRIGGEARYFFVVSSMGELMQAIQYADTKSLPFFILGGGSNTLFQDEGFSGVVIKIITPGVIFGEADSEGRVRATAGAGVSWDTFVETCVSRGLWGIENLSFIPGSLGGAVVQNIGAYGCEIKDAVESVEVFDIDSGQVGKISRDECNFGYRTSLFKTPNEKKYVVLSADFKLSISGNPNLSYADMSRHVAEKGKTPTLLFMREAVISIRQSKLPNVDEVGTAGSFFKNPIITRGEYEAMVKRFPELPGIKEGEDNMKLSAGWLLDHIGGFKGERQGGAMVFEKQTLVIVNDNSASADDVLLLAERMKKKILSETGITLEPEVVVVESHA